MANVNIQMDNDLKQQFETFCNDVGLSMNMAIMVFVKKTVRENRIPFEIGIEIPNSETLEAIEEVKKMKADPSIGKTYSDVDQMMEELLADV